MAVALRSGVFSVGNDSVRMYNRGGLLLAEIPAAAMNPPAEAPSSGAAGRPGLAVGAFAKRALADAGATRAAGAPGSARGAGSSSGGLGGATPAEAPLPLYCALPLPDLAARYGLTCEARVAVGGERPVVSLFDCTVPNAAPGSRALPKPLASVSVGHPVALMRASSRFVAAASRNCTCNARLPLSPPPQSSRAACVFDALVLTEHGGLRVNFGEAAGLVCAHGCGAACACSRPPPVFARCGCLRNVPAL